MEDVDHINCKSTEYYSLVGSIYGYSSRVLAANGHMLPYAWNYSVIYNQTFGRMPYLVQRLSANDLSVNLDPARRALDYGVTASIAKGDIPIM